MTDIWKTSQPSKKFDKKSGPEGPPFKCRNVPCGYLTGEAAGFAVLSVFTSDGFLSSTTGLTFVLSPGFLSVATGEPVGEAIGAAVAAGDGLAAGTGVDAVFGVFLTSGVDEHAPTVNANAATDVANINDLLIVFSLNSRQLSIDG